MIVLGIALLLIGLLAHVHLLYIVGLVVLVLGLILVALGAVGRSVGPRRWYF